MLNQPCRSIPQLTAMVALFLVCAGAAWAKPQIMVSQTATREVVEIKNGIKKTVTVPVTSAVAGDSVTYTVTYSNTGNEAAANAVIDNPIANGMSYIDNSAAGRDAEIFFSIDGGKSYKKPSLLTYETTLAGGGREKHTARPEEYSHIRWIIKSIAPGAQGTVSFKAHFK